jgi:hypothetical protein
MKIRILTALICLLALCVELTLDTSTSFVRVSSAPRVGKLVVMDRGMEKQAPSNQDAGSNHDLDSLTQVSPSHSGDVVAPVVLTVLVPVSRHITEFISYYQGPRLSEPPRPPEV